MTTAGTAGALPRLHGEGSQHVFGVLLATLAEPGLVRRFEVLDGHRSVPPVTLGPLALADVDIGVGGDDDVLVARLAAATGARVAQIGDADMVVLARTSDDRLRRCPVGSALAPEDGAKVFVAVAALGPGAGALRLEMSGPGVPSTRTIAVDGLEAAAVGVMGRRFGPYPAGLDCWLVSTDGDVVAVPRSADVRAVATIGGS